MSDRSQAISLLVKARCAALKVADALNEVIGILEARPDLREIAAAMEKSGADRTGNSEKRV